MRKINVFIILSIFFVYPIFTKAFFQLPDPANLTIIVNVNGGDNTFHFDTDLQNNGSQFLFNSLDLATINGSGLGVVSLDTFGFSTYYINPLIPTGWTLNNMNCISDNSGDTINIGTSSIQIPNPVADSNITCIFNVYKNIRRVPILVVPGLFGTEIYKGHTLLWADTVRMANPLNDDSFMDPLEFTNGSQPLDTSLTLGGVITVINPLGRFQKYDYTEGLINLLTSSSIGYTEGKDLFTFPYDWRYGVAEDVVSQLQGEINYIVNTTGSNTVDIVAHSTGGLIVKEYVKEHPSDNDLGKVVFVGVPNLGAPKAFQALINGDSFGIPGLNPDEMKKLAQNIPVAYDLAPSQEYVNQVGDFLHRSNPFVSLIDPGKDLNYIQSIQEFENQGLINNQAMSDSQSFHTSKFDNYDIRSNGVDVYNIIGCKSGTFGKFTEVIRSDGTSEYDFPQETTGDGTVPLLSAQTIPADSDHVFFAPKADHGKMPSQDGIRQEIVNILTGSQLDTKGKILSHNQVQSNPKLCKIKGESINIKSPVSIGVTDQDGNFSGVASDGSIENDIPGADYEIWGEHKYVFLPTDDYQNYQINLAGTGDGSFTVDDQSLDDDTITKTQVFSNLPVTTSLTGSVNLASTTTLILQATPTSSPVTVQPSAVLNSNQSQDLTPPSSTSTINGDMGSPSFYRSNVRVNLWATDPIFPNQENQTSGLFKIQYSLDGGSYQAYNPSSPIVVTSEGQHIISFFSTDRAGNNEPEQFINFTIDKTPPELGIQFDPTIKDLSFSATDSLPTQLLATTLAILNKKGFKLFTTCPPPNVLDQDDLVTATDAAGNVTKIQFQDKNRKSNSKADIKTLSYNSKVVDLSKNLLHFDWLYDNQGILQNLTQQVQSKNNFNLSSIYNLGKTFLVSKDQKGKGEKSSNSLILVKVSTARGDLAWSY